MRPIKFRAWDKKTKKFVCKDFDVWGEVTVFGLIDQYLYENKEKDECTLQRHNDIIITQLTGVKDINNLDIYEGDIVKIVSPTDRKEPFLAEVYYDINVASFSGRVKGYPVDLFLHNPFKEGDWIPEIIQYLDTERSIEVIGNIFENPELLNHE